MTARIPFQGMLRVLISARSIDDSAWRGFTTCTGTLARVDVWENTGIATEQGARIGDSEQKILELYPGATVEPHAYEGPEGHYVRTRDAGGGHGYVFETDGQKVTRFRAGRYPEVEWIEGCL